MRINIGNKPDLKPIDIVHRHRHPPSNKVNNNNNYATATNTSQLAVPPKDNGEMIVVREGAVDDFLVGDEYLNQLSPTTITTMV